MALEVIYKTKLPADKLPYYRLTTYMDENFEDPELMSWFEWIVSKDIPCTIAMGVDPGTYGKLAVWVMGQEHQDQAASNSEQIGRIVIESNWPIDQVRAGV